MIFFSKKRSAFIKIIRISNSTTYVYLSLPVSTRSPMSTKICLPLTSCEYLVMKDVITSPSLDDILHWWQKQSQLRDTLHVKQHRVWSLRKTLVPHTSTESKNKQMLPNGKRFPKKRFYPHCTFSISHDKSCCKSSLRNTSLLCLEVETFSVTHSS